MPDSNHDSWLTNYYGRIQSECALSIERRDRITRQCYLVLAAGIAIYVGFFANGIFVPPLGRFGVIAGIFFVLIRFFFQSMIAYGFFVRWRYLREQIERYWMKDKEDDAPTLKRIREDIVRYDHDKALPDTGRNLVMGQVKSGFMLIFAVAAIPLGIELYLEQSWYYVPILAGLVIYVIIERHAFKTYDQMRPAKSNA